MPIVNPTEGKTTKPKQKVFTTWPGGTPTWAKLQLQTLASGHHLFGIPPNVLAAVEKYQSGFYYPMQGTYAINSSGYGGYFGLTTKGNKYHAPTGKWVGITRTEARTGSLTSYRQQAEVTAAAYSGYEKWTHKTLRGALIEGTPSSGQSEWITSGGTPSGANAPTNPTTYHSTTRFPYGHPITPTTGQPTSLGQISTSNTSVAILAGLTRALNPSNTTTGFKGLLVGSVGDAMKLIAFRGGAAIAFLVVAALGVNMILRGPGQRANPIERYVGLGQKQVRLGQAERRLDIQSFDAQTRRAPPTRRTERTVTSIRAETAAQQARKNYEAATARQREQRLAGKPPRARGPRRPKS